MQRFYKNHSLNFIRAVKTFIFLLLAGLLPSAIFAQNFTVTNTADGHGTNQLRGAIEASDAAGGTHVITVNPGTYTLTLGEITFGNNAENITINGAGAASTIISMTSGAGRDRIFFINPTGTTNSPVISVSGLTFQNGYLTSDIYGGAAICAGGGSAESLTISNCVFNNNILPPGDYGGAAVCMQVRGNLSIDNCTFTNNVSNDADGGAVLFIIFGSGVGTGFGTLSVTNSTFDNNSVVFPGAGASNGGALAINGQAGVTPFGATVTNNTFTNNSADGYGGAISTDNGVAGVTYQIHFNRITGNTSGTSALSSGLQFAEAGGDVNADNNWWGCNSNPVGASSTAPCDQAGGDVAGGGALILTKWMQLKTTASPSTICNSTPTTLGNTSVITTSFLKNSAGETLTTGNLSRVIGLPVTWTATKGTLSGQQTTIQAAGVAIATFTSDGTGGTATVNAQVDDVPATETTPARANITVNITSVAPTGVTGTTTVCNGTGTTITVAGGIKGTGAVTEWFTGSCGGTLVFTGDAFSTGNLAATTTYYVRYNGTCNTTTCATVVVTVNDVTAGTVGADQTICSGGDPAAFTESAASTGSGALTYQWQSSTTSCAAGFSNIPGATATTYDPPSGLATTTYYHRVTTSTLNAVACTATSNCITVTVNNVTGGTVGSDQTICNGGDPAVFTQSAASTGSGALTYQWQSSTTSCAAGFSDIAGATSTTYDPPAGLATTTYYHRVTTSTLNTIACTATSNCITVFVNNVTAGTAGSDQTICSGGDPAAFTQSVASTGAGALTYQWQSSTTDCVSGFSNIGGATAATYDPPTGLITTTYYHRIATSTLNAVQCTATGNCITVTVNNVTGGTVGSNQTICSGGDPAAFTESAASTGTGALTYQWQSSTTSCAAGFSDIAGATSTTYDPPSGLATTTYYHRVTTSTLNAVACTATSSCITVTVNSVTGGTVATNQAVCPGGDPAAFTQSAASTGSGALTYQWESSTADCASGFAPIAGATGTTYDAPSGLAVTTYYHRVTTSTLNAVTCTATSNCITVTVNPTNTVTLTSAAGTDAQTVLVNTPITTITYSTTGATGATFSGLPTGVTGSWAANVVTISGTPSVQGLFNYTVTLTGGCGNVTATGSINVVVCGITLTSGAGSNTAIACLNTAMTPITYSTNSATGISFSGLPPGVSAAWAANVVTISGTPTSLGVYNYTITPTGGGCTGIVTATGTITVNAVPATPTITPGGPTTFCAGGSVTLTSSSATGNQWYLNGNPIGGATNQTYIATASGNYTVTVTASGCPSAPSAATVVTVNPIPATPTITPGGPTTFCTGGTVTLTSSSATGNQWYLNGNPMGGETAQTYVVGVSGNVTVVVTQSGCSSAPSAPTTVTVNPIPATPTITPGGPTTFCAGGSVTLTSSSATGNQWYLNGNPIGGATAQTYSATASGNYTVTVTTSGCTSAPSAATAVTVNPIPATPTITPGGPTTFCTGGSVTLTSSSATGNQWYLNGNPIGGETNQNYVATASGNYTVIVTSLGCSSASSAPTSVTVNPIPATPTVTPGGPTTFCAGGSVTLTSSSATGNQWYLNGNPIGGATAQTYSATANGNYTVTVTTSGCTSAPSAATAVTVNPIPATPTITPGGPTTFCTGGSVTLTSSSATGSQWYLNGNPIGGATNQTFVANATGNYTVIVTSLGCSSAPSSATAVAVNAVTGGTVATNQAICPGGDPAAFTQTAASTGSGVLSYQWQSSTTDCASGFSDIAGATGTVYDVPAGLAVTTYFHRVTTSTLNTVACTATSNCITVTVNPINTITLTSAAGTDAQTVLINTAITPITYATTSATGATFSGLPTGVTGSWAGNVVTISGTPSVSGLFNYTVTLTGGCGVVTATGSINVIVCSITRTSPAGTDAQVVCINSAITNIIYSTTGATGATFSGLPTGVSGSWAANTATISGTPSVSGTFSYTVTPTGGGCSGAVTATGTITVNPTPAGSASAQTICSGGTTSVTLNATTPAAGTTYAYTAAIQTTPTGGTITGQAAGTANPIAQTLINTGTTAGVIRYTVTPTYTNAGQSCTGASFTVDVTVNPNPTGSATAQTICNGGTTSVTLGANTPAAGTTYSYTAAIQTTPTGGTITGQASGSANPIAQTLTNTGTSAGVIRYTVTPTYTNAGQACTGASFTVDVTVNPAVTVTAVANQVVCNNATTTTVYFNGNTNVAVCGTVNEGGAVTMNAPAGAVFSQINFASYGTPNGSCGSFTIGGCHAANSSSIVSVIGLGQNSFTVGANNGVFGDPCGGTPKRLYIQASYPAAGTTYSWTNSNTSIGLAASGTGNIPAFNAVNAGTSPAVATITITPSYTNGGITCTGASTSFTITVNPTATVTTVSNQVVCNNAPTSAVNFTSPTTGGTIVYNWTNNTTSIGLAASGTGNIASFNATNATTAPVTATITVTPSYTNGAVTCVGTPSTFTITVNPTATVTAVANQVVCNNAPTTAVNFTSPTTGGTIVYNWTNNTTSIGLAGSGTGNIASFNATNATTTPVTATITVTPSYTNGSVTCVGTPSTFTITVNPTATVTAVANQVVCNNAPTTAVTFTSPTTGGTIVYNWTNNTTSIGLAASGTGNIASFNATNATTAPVTATITVTPSYTNGAVTCVGTPSTFTITVNPTATVTAVANQVVCNNAPTTAVNFTSPTTGGTIVYNWTNNTTSIGLAASGTGNIASFNATNATTAPVTATITVTPSYTNGAVTCVGTPSTFTITVNPTATVTAVTNQVVCNNANTTAVTFSSPTTGGTIVYNWTNNTTSIGLAASGTGNIASFVATNATTAPVTATITVTPSYTNGAVTCVGTPSTFTITVNPTATVTAVANQVVCNNSPTTAVNFTSPTTGGTIVYNWTNNTTSIGLAASGTGNIASFNATNATNAPVTATITVTPSYTNGAVTCVGTPSTFTITVNPTATVNATANQVVCNNSPTTAVTFTSPTTGGTIVYNWTNNTPAIGLAASGSGNIASFNATNSTTAPLVATITVTPSYTNGAVTCVGTPSTFTITVNPTATVTAVPNQVVCNNSPTTAVTFTSPTTGGTIVYNWTNNTTSIGLAASGTGNIASFNGTNATTAPVTATITVTPSYTNGAVTCVGTPSTFTITVNPTATVTAVANQVVCNNSPTTAVTFSSPTTGGTIVYNWTNNTPSIGLAASGSGNIASFNATNAGTAPVTATITVTPAYTNGGVTCTGTPRTFTITVNPTATVTPVSNQTLCHNTSTAAVTFSSPTTGGTIVYNWTNNTPSIGLAASGTGNIPSFIATNTGAAAVTATITVTPSYTSGSVTCTGTPFSFTITVNTLSSAPTGATASSTQLCGAGYITLTAQGGFLGTGASYKWYSGSCGGTLVGTGQVLANVYAYQTTTYYVRIEGTCNTTTCQSVTVNVDPQPVVVITAVPTTSSNPSHPVKIFATVSPAGNNYSYQWFHNGTAIPGHPNDTLNIPASGTGDYYVKVTAAPSGCSATSNTLNIHDSVTHHQLFIQPNPNNGLFTVSTYASPQEIGTTRTVIVMDASGRRVFAHVYPVTVAYDLMDVNLYARPKGAYTVTVLDSSGKVIASAIVMIGSY